MATEQCWTWKMVVPSFLNWHCMSNLIFCNLIVMFNSSLSWKALLFHHRRGGDLCQKEPQADHEAPRSLPEGAACQDRAPNVAWQPVSQQPFPQRQGFQPGEPGDQRGQRDELHRRVRAAGRDGGRGPTHLSEREWERVKEWRNGRECDRMSAERRDGKTVSEVEMDLSLS